MKPYFVDFIVSYRLYSQEEGGRKITFQGLRCDFLYQEDEAKIEIYIIHPTFLNEDGSIFEDEKPVLLLGRAKMWILSSEIKEKIHRSRIKVGIKGYFMEGARKIGEVVVDEVVGLYE